MGEETRRDETRRGEKGGREDLGITTRWRCLAENRPRDRGPAAALLCSTGTSARMAVSRGPRNSRRADGPARTAGCTVKTARHRGKAKGKRRSGPVGSGRAARGKNSSDAHISPNPCVTLGQYADIVHIHVKTLE
jgi:hypothetical protein